MNKTKNINGISNIVDQYDLFIIDQWGVLHGGQNGYQNAIDCIKNLSLLKKKLIIISNSSKRKNATINRLPKLGFNKEDFVEVLTSGEMVWRYLNQKNNNFIKKLGNKCFHLFDNTIEGAEFEEGLKYDFVRDLEEASFILGCTPLPGLKTLDYVPLLEKALKKKLPFICANPDFETIESSADNLIICMGTIAKLYKDLGGSVFILGKPSVEIYIEATKEFVSIDKRRMLAIGDSLHHDIKGALNFDIDSLLITSGIHKSIFNESQLLWSDTNNHLSNFKFKPTYSSIELQF